MTTLPNGCGTKEEWDRIKERIRAKAERLARTRPWAKEDNEEDEQEQDDCCDYCGGSGGAEPAICRMCGGTGMA